MDIMLLKNARDVYTPVIFNLVYREYEKSCNLIFKGYSQNLQLIEYEVGSFPSMRQHTVTYNSESQSIECSCKKFQFIGILCSHVLRVLNHLNIIIIPPKYILKRWTKHARSGCVLDNKGQIIKEDPKVVVLNRYKDNCRSAVEVSSRIAESEEASSFFKRKMMEVSIEVDKILNKRSLATSTGHSDINCQTDQVRTNDTIEKDDATQAKGMKKKGGASRVKGRPKSCVEKKKKNKDNNKFGSIRYDFISIPTPTTQNMPFLQGCQVPIIVDPNLTHVFFYHCAFYYNFGLVVYSVFSLLLLYENACQ
ncbi:putative Zinc finger, SWIM-type, FHY3/FAR1 family [Lupinus albus]|uniref:Protein FAR1-RELATED SEQUENCE n=1 Tax=Lupinus albus TaxID=3870 RepID=A0A6A4Q193_LUPAL|nr:putative Zinc finger, SWIM-type, FHY3/FAR1 family [Lupinus albus]